MTTGQFKTARPKKLTEDELEHIANAGLPKLDLIAAWANRHLTCSHCRRCTSKCEVLNGPGLDIGGIENAYRSIKALSEDDQVPAVIDAMQARPELYHALRRCCFCGYCTSTCQAHQFAPEIMRDWRQLFSRAGYMPPADSRMVMVDNEWHIFSAYRAIYGIEYSEFYQLRDAATWGPGYIDTVLFPGCSLASYTPDLVRAVGGWLTNHGFAWALSDDCCGSPLMSAGLTERAAALRERVVDQMRAAGVKRCVTVCPGCGEELAENMPADIDIIPLPELLWEKTRDAATAEEAGFSPLADAVNAASPEKTLRSLTFFDSCHDRRDNRHGLAIRKLMRKYLPNVERRELDHRRKNSLCCGAGGAVGGYDDDLSARRVARVIDEARATGADALVSMCPTCTYTIGQANLGQPSLGRTAADGIRSHHYLELLFGIETDWAAVFANLEGMWSGEYGPWLTETFFS